MREYKIRAKVKNTITNEWVIQEEIYFGDNKANALMEFARSVFTVAAAWHEHEGRPVIEMAMWDLPYIIFVKDMGEVEDHTGSEPFPD